MTGHQIEVAFFGAFREHRAKCSCGWIGSYFSRKDWAEREAAAHVKWRKQCPWCARDVAVNVGSTGTGLLEIHEVKATLDTCEGSGRYAWMNADDEGMQS